MHYCFITSGEWGPNPGIAYVLRRDLGNALARHGVQVTFLLDDLPANHVDLRFEPGVQAAYVPNAREFGQFKNRRRVLREVAPDFVQLMIQSVKGWLAVRRERSIRIIGEWDEWPNAALKGWRLMADRYRAAWIRKHAALHLVSTHYAQEMFKSRWNLQTLYLPFATYLTPRTDDGMTPFTEPTAVYVGNFYPQWDHEIILRAAELLAAIGKKQRIMLLGGGPDLEKWRTWIGEKGLDNVSLPGFMSGDMLWRHLRHAHTLLFPMRDTQINRVRCPSKTFPYMQAGRPLITNRVGELPYLLGEGATYIADGTEAFAEAIDAALSAPRAADVNYHIENHTWDARAKTLIDALQRLPARA